MAQSPSSRLRANLAVLREAAAMARADEAGDGVLRAARALNAELTGLLEGLERSVRREIDDLNETLALTRREIAALRPNALAEHLPETCAELDSLIADAETAADTILAEAESAMAETAEDIDQYRLAVKERMLRIIVACGFQDLAGQRATKVAARLRGMETRIARFAAALDIADAEADPAWPVWNAGPGPHGAANDQAVIDSIFSGDGDYADIEAFLSPYDADEDGA